MGRSPFQVFTVSLDLVRALRRPLATIRKADPDLFRQLRRAANSVSLNIAEGNRRRGRDRIHLWNIASGSADEVRSGLVLSEAWGDVTADEVHDCLELADRVLAMLYRLTH